jgi:hypothetical protein
MLPWHSESIDAVSGGIDAFASLASQAKQSGAGAKLKPGHRLHFSPGIGKAFVKREASDAGLPGSMASLFGHAMPPARHGKAWQGMARHGMARHGKAWQGMASHGKAWQDMARHGMVRYGKAR